MFDLESEVMRGPGSIPTGGNILSLGFWGFFCLFFLFSHNKDKNANIGISVRMWKTQMADVNRSSKQGYQWPHKKDNGLSYSSQKYILIQIGDKSTFSIMAEGFNNSNKILFFSGNWFAVWLVPSIPDHVSRILTGIYYTNNILILYGWLSNQILWTEW